MLMFFATSNSAGDSAPYELRMPHEKIARLSIFTFLPLAVPAVDVGDGEGLAFGRGGAMDYDVSDLSHAFRL